MIPCYQSRSVTYSHMHMHGLFVFCIANTVYRLCLRKGLRWENISSDGFFAPGDNAGGVILEVYTVDKMSEKKTMLPFKLIAAEFFH